MKNIRIFHLKKFMFGGKIFSIFEEAYFRNEVRMTTESNEHTHET